MTQSDPAVKEALIEVGDVVVPVSERVEVASPMTAVGTDEERLVDWHDRACVIVAHHKHVGDGIVMGHCRTKLLVTRSVIEREWSVEELLVGYHHDREAPRLADESHLGGQALRSDNYRFIEEGRKVANVAKGFCE